VEASYDPIRLAAMKTFNGANRAKHTWTRWAMTPIAADIVLQWAPNTESAHLPCASFGELREPSMGHRRHTVLSMTQVTVVVAPAPSNGATGNETVERLLSLLRCGR